MPASPDFGDILVAPLQDVLVRMSEGVSDAQRRLDDASMAAQRTLAAQHPELSAIGYRVTWYQIPEVDIELKVEAHYEERTEGTERRLGLFLSPFNARHQQTGFSADGASTVRLKIVPIPPPIVEQGP